jgi:hypothetical protein
MIKWPVVFESVATHHGESVWQSKNYLPHGQGVKEGQEAGGSPTIPFKSTLQ